MAKLFMAIFDAPTKAYSVLHELEDMEFEHLVALKDAVVVSKNARGKMRIHQTHEITPGLGALSGGATGVIVGSLLAGPIGAGLAVGSIAIGLLAGTGIGALVASLIDTGIDDKLINQLGSELQPSTSALFVLAKEGLDDVQAELQRLAQRIISVDLDTQKVEELERALHTPFQSPSEDQGDTPKS